VPDTTKIVAVQYPLVSYDQALFCVFDGHGPGSISTHTVVLVLHTSVLENISRGAHEALTAAFSAVESSLQRHAAAIESGTTAVAAIMCGAELYLAHVGDSRAIIGRKAENGTIKPLQLTKDHTPYCAEEVPKAPRLSSFN
jgi:serine/threonine protein phosphatase PrpC